MLPAKTLMKADFPQSVFDQVLSGTVSSKYKRDYSLRNHQDLIEACDQVVSVLKKYGCRITKIHLVCQLLVVPIFDRKNCLAGQLTNNDIEKFSATHGVLHHRFEYDLCSDLYILFERSIEHRMLTSTKVIFPTEQAIGTQIMECSWHVKAPNI